MSIPGMPQTQTLLMQLLRMKWQVSKSRNSEQGLTLIECLMAVAVMGLTVGLVLPPLFIASATRVQTRRAEQALQVAQGEVDRIRILVTRGDHFPADLPGLADSLEGAPAFTGLSTVLKTSANCANRYTGGNPVPDVNTALMVDVNADCEPDLLMQVFRTRGSTTRTETISGSARPSSFDLGVRVYSYVARNNLGSLETEPASLGLTNGEGGQRNRPLAVLHTRVTWDDQDSTACSYHTEGGQVLESCTDTF